MRANRNLLALLIVSSGCAGEPVPKAGARHDPERARGVLVAVLDAWKKGEARTLARRDPPIRFVDDDLASGFRLFDYEIEEPDAPISEHENVAVILSLRDAREQAVRRETRYQVATELALAVLRSDH